MFSGRFDRNVFWCRPTRLTGFGLGRMIQVMFLRSKTRRRDGKAHRYWSLVENRRVRGNRVVQRQVLYLGEINNSQHAAWSRSIEVFAEGRSRAGQSRAGRSRAGRSRASRWCCFRKGARQPFRRVRLLRSGSATLSFVARGNGAAAGLPVISGISWS